MTRQLKKFLRREDGASMVEMTLAAPFLFLLGLGVFEFGNVLYQHHLISTGIRDAARYLARYPGPDPTDLCAGDPSAGETTAKNIAVTGSPTGTDKRVSWWSTADINVAYTSIANPIVGGTGSRTYRDCPTVIIVRVSTNVSYPGLGYLNVIGLSPTLNFSMYHDERYMRR